MGTGQMMLTIGAMLLLSTVLLRMNNTILATDTTVFNSKYELTAISLAQSIIEEAKRLRFDENDVGATGLPADLSTIGKEGESNKDDFDDMDDYHNYSFSTSNDPTLISATFDVNCKVEYVNPNNPDQVSAAKTWCKKLTVTVTSPFMMDNSGSQYPVVISQVFSYF